jgi:hypothetical protein
MRTAFRQFAPVGAVLVTAAALRGAGLGAKSLWFNEAVSASVLDFSFGDVARRCAEPSSSHPPLYFLMLHVWGHLSHSDASLRALSAAAGVLTVLGTYALVRALGDLAGPARRPPGAAPLLAAALVALNPLQIQLSQQLRNYATAAMLFVWAGWALARALGGGPRRGAFWVGSALLAAAACYTHHAVLLCVAGQGVFVTSWLWSDRAPGRWRRQGRWALTAAAVFAAVYLVPWLPRLRAQSETFRGDSFLQPLTYRSFVEEVFLAACATFDHLRPDPTAAAAVAALLAAAMAALAVRVRRGDAYLGLTGLVPVLLMTAYSYGSNRSLVYSRYLSFAQVAWLAGLATLVARVPQRPERVALSALLIGWSVSWCAWCWPSIGPVSKPGMRAAMGYLVANRRPGEPVVVRSPFMYYGAAHYTRGVVRPRLCVADTRRSAQRGSEHLRSEDFVTLDALAASNPKAVWVVDSESYTRVAARVFRFEVPEGWRPTSRRSFVQDYHQEAPVTVVRYEVGAGGAPVPDRLSASRSARRRVQAGPSRGRTTSSRSSSLPVMTSAQRRTRSTLPGTGAGSTQRWTQGFWKPPARISRPSRPNARAVGGAGWDNIGPTGNPVATSQSRISPRPGGRSSAVTTIRPSALNAAATTGPWWTRGLPIGRPSRASQSRAAWPWPPVSTALPSGLNAIVRIRPWWTIGAPRGRPSTASQSRATWSVPATSAVRPSGPRATTSIGPPWTRALPRGRPLAASQSRAVPSPPPTSTDDPSGLKAAWSEVSPACRTDPPRGRPVAASQARVPQDDVPGS